MSPTKIAYLKFVFSKKGTKFDVGLTLCNKCQMNGEDSVNFWGLLRRHELFSIQLSYKLFF